MAIFSNRYDRTQMEEIGMHNVRFPHRKGAISRLIGIVRTFVGMGFTGATMIIRPFVLIAIVCMVSSGCAVTQLRVDHIKQAKSLTSIFEQQVLDNLAMFKQNPDSVPFFAVPGAGTAKVNEGATLGVSTLNGPAHTNIGPLGLSRGHEQAWALQAINDAERLRLMKQYYQEAICTLELIPSKKSNYSNACQKVGGYCGCYVELCPNSYAGFSELVLNILQCAVGDKPKPPSSPTMQVEDFIYSADGARLEKIHRYTAEVRDKKLIQGDAAPDAREGEIIGPVPLFEFPTPTEQLFREQERQLRLNLLFPE